MRRMLFLVGLGLVAGLAVACDATTDPGAVGPAVASSSPAAIGEPARDDVAEFTVAAVDCGKTQLGGEYIAIQAKGQFCLLTMSVTNIGTEIEFFSDANIVAFAADGTRFSADSNAAIYVNNDASTLFTQIDPGESVNGVIVFDIPTGASLARVELHDSASSNGVQVQLGQ